MEKTIREILAQQEEERLQKENLMGIRIARKRKELDMTMQQLATILGVQPSAVNKWEKGIVSNIKRETISQMSRIFGCSPVWLMGFTDDEHPEKKKSVSIGANDAKLLKDFHSLNDRDKQIILNMIDAMLKD